MSLVRHAATANAPHGASTSRGERGPVVSKRTGVRFHGPEPSAKVSPSSAGDERACMEGGGMGANALTPRCVTSIATPRSGASSMRQGVSVHRGERRRAFSAPSGSAPSYRWLAGPTLACTYGRIFGVAFDYSSHARLCVVCERCVGFVWARARPLSPVPVRPPPPARGPVFLLVNKTMKNT